MKFKHTDDNFSEAHSANFGEPSDDEFKRLNASVSPFNFLLFF